MARTRNYSAQPETSKRPPATDPREREKQMIALAMDVAEEQLRSRTASSQVITHFLKLATRDKELEIKKVEQEIIKMQAQTRSMETESRLEQLYIGAMEAMKSYGSSINHADDEDD